MTIASEAQAQSPKAVERAAHSESSNDRVEIGAALHRLELFAVDPEVVARFYSASFRMTVTHEADVWTCRGPDREIVLCRGEAGRLRSAVFRFRSRSRHAAHRAALMANDVDVSSLGDDDYAVLDPEGRLIAFVVEPAPLEPRQAMRSVAPLQHFGVRTPAPAKLVDFYVSVLRFTLSDRVLDEQGELTAAFLRTDSAHHALAIFRSPMVRFDHFSCEAPDWYSLRDWADHMSTIGVDLAWGVGRHGPGNDNFLMVEDPDGNMAEISTDLEVCVPGRPVGVWPHVPKTLNQWGVAIMRS